MFQATSVSLVRLSGFSARRLARVKAFDGLELLVAWLGAEVERLAVVDGGECLASVDGHPADRVGGASAHRHGKQGDEDERRYRVQRSLVVELDRPEYLGRSLGIRPTAPKSRSTTSAAATMVRSISAVLRSAKPVP
jgi:hypothetical protein